MKMKEKRKKHQKCEWLGKALGKKCGVSQILKDEHGRHREGNSGHREEDTHGHTGAECVKHYKLGLGTGHRKGAGGGGKQNPHPNMPGKPYQQFRLYSC